jgi:hypothetical protein
MTLLRGICSLALVLALTACHGPAGSTTQAPFEQSTLASQGGNGAPYEGGNCGLGNFYDYAGGPLCSDSQQVVIHAICDNEDGWVATVGQLCSPMSKVPVPQADFDFAPYNVRLVGYGAKVFDASARDLSVLGLPTLDPVETWCRWVDSSNAKQGLDIVIRSTGPDSQASASIFYDFGSGPREVPAFDVSRAASPLTYSAPAARLEVRGGSGQLDVVIDGQVVSKAMSCRSGPSI